MAGINFPSKLFSIVAVLLLFSVSTAQPCPSFCTFRFCFRLGSTVFVLRENPNFLLRPALRPQGSFPCEVARSGRVRRELRNIVSGEASVSPGRSGRPFVPISTFRDERPRFQPDFFSFGFFEVTGRPSIVRRPARGNQIDDLRDLCVRIPITRHDLLRPNGSLIRRVRPRGPRACAGFRARIAELDVELLWDTQNNFNIRLTEPSGVEINRANPISPTGGRLGGDSGSSGCIAFFPTERVRYLFLPTVTVTSGTYTVRVDNVNQCSPSSEVTLRVSLAGTIILDDTMTVVGTGSNVIVRSFQIP